MRDMDGRVIQLGDRLLTVFRRGLAKATVANLREKDNVVLIRVEPDGEYVRRNPNDIYLLKGGE